MYSCDGKAEFQQPLLKSSMSHEQRWRDSCNNINWFGGSTDKYYAINECWIYVFISLKIKNYSERQCTLYFYDFSRARSLNFKIPEAYE